MFIAACRGKKDMRQKRCQHRFCRSKIDFDGLFYEHFVPNGTNATPDA